MGASRAGACAASRAGRLILTIRRESLQASRDRSAGPAPAGPVSRLPPRWSACSRRAG